jgi:hypothetical protein
VQTALPDPDAGFQAGVEQKTQRALRRSGCGCGQTKKWSKGGIMPTVSTSNPPHIAAGNAASGMLFG